jgi:hypothetical protein
VAILVSEAICLFRAHEVSALFEECSQVEGAVGIAQLLGPAISVLCPVLVPALLKQHSKVDRGARATPVIRLAVIALGCGHVAAFLVPDPEIKAIDGAEGPV